MSVRNRYRRYISTRTVSSQGRTVRSLSVRRAVEYEACQSVCVSARGLSVRVAVRYQRRSARMHIGTRLISSQGSIIRGLSVRIRIGTETYQ